MSEHQKPIFRYTAAIALVMTALLVWSISSALHETRFILFVAAVLVSARFLGLGPGIFAAALSAAIIDYIVFPPHFALSYAPRDVEQMAVFLAVSLLVASLARQASRADVRSQRSQAQLAAIVESSADAILSKDVNGIITSWNRGAEQLYGYRADEVIGRHVSILAPPDQPDEIPSLMAKLLSGESLRRYMTERVRKDGARLTVYLSISPLRDATGKIVGAAIIAQDITGQKRAQEAMLKNEKLATAGRLAASIAHEINNPLEAISNLLYLARRDEAKRSEYLSMAEKEIQRLSNIAQQTLGLVRDAASATPLNVSLVLEEVLRLYMRKLSAKKIHVEKRYAETAEIRGFPGELRQVFSNLIANAIDAMPDHGHLHLRVERSHQWRNGSAPGVRITIADDGHGIDPQYASRVFEPFFTTKPDSGTGLGLWLSYNIVQKHGGKIRLRSRTSPGKSGTVFTIFLPNAGSAAKSALAS